jgi:hypothetical protein
MKSLNSISTQSVIVSPAKLLAVLCVCPATSSWASNTRRRPCAVPLWKICRPAVDRKCLCVETNQSLSMHRAVQSSRVSVAWQLPTIAEGRLALAAVHLIRQHHPLGSRRHSLKGVRYSRPRLYGKVGPCIAGGVGYALATPIGQSRSWLLRFSSVVVLLACRVWLTVLGYCWRPVVAIARAAVPGCAER